RSVARSPALHPPKGNAIGVKLIQAVNSSVQSELNGTASTRTRPQPQMTDSNPNVATNSGAAHEQQLGWQQPLAFVARTKALMNFPSTSFAIASTSIPCAVKNVRASPIR